MSSSGAIIMSVFAAAWWAVGVGVTGHSALSTFVVPWVVTGAIVAAALRRYGADARLTEKEDSRRGRLVGVASAIEGVAILVAINVLARLRRPDLTAPLVAVIVGLHFLPLAQWLPAPLYYATSALLVALGIAGLGIPDGGQRLLVISVGAACVLWLTCLFVVRHKVEQRPEGR
jgi:hypothetical protein